MKLADYNAERFRHYARGRALAPGQLEAWIGAFAALLPERRPLAGLDVGSGTGRFTPALADAFGPVTGVEPSAVMREAAERDARHPDVRHLAGAAEDLPVPSASADYAVMMQSWHHVEDKPRAARELARVVKPGGRLLLRAGFSDHMPRIWWIEQFPHGPEVDASMFQPLHEVVAGFTTAGWRMASYGTVAEPPTGTRAQLLEQLRLRTHTIFSLFTPEDEAAGFRRLEQAVAQEPDTLVPGVVSPVLAFRAGSVAPGRISADVDLRLSIRSGRRSPARRLRSVAEPRHRVSAGIPRLRLLNGKPRNHRQPPPRV
jgi:ubiquinone/menaquinone biosynthesis C-methylase UbiE